MKKFYGHAKSRSELELWSKLTMTKLTKNIHIPWPGTENIDMKQFFEQTSPKYFVLQCQFEQIDCRRMWRTVTTIDGMCLEFDPLKVSEANYERASRQKVKVKDFQFE